MSRAVSFSSLNYLLSELTAENLQAFCHYFSNIYLTIGLFYFLNKGFYNFIKLFWIILVSNMVGIFC